MTILRILYICSHNTARSQIAEALTRFLGGERVEVHSAGIQQGEVAPETRDFIRSLGFNPDDYQSKALDQFIGQKWDYIITVCDAAREACPNFPGDHERIHWSITDPNNPKLSPGQRAHLFREVALELRQRVDLFLQSALGKKTE